MYLHGNSFQMGKEKDKALCGICFKLNEKFPPGANGKKRYTTPFSFTRSRKFPHKFSLMENRIIFM